MANAESTTTTFCGVLEYLVPEMLQQQPYTKTVDFWSLDILIFEMMMGIPPFTYENQSKLITMILTDEIEVSEWISEEAKDLIQNLLNKYPNKRFGAVTGIDAIKQHPCFHDLNWEDVEAERKQPEWGPEITKAGEKDMTNKENEGEPETGTVDSVVQMRFQNFT
jgi:serine/threonine protein kinase